MGQQCCAETEQFTLPELPYDFNALEPVILAEIMELHYKKHHQTYVNNLNKALDEYFDAVSKKDLPRQIALQKAIQFNGGGHINHSIFWTNLAPKQKGGGTPPSGKLADAIKQEFGSLENFIKKFNETTVAIQGSGWGWLGFCKDQKRLYITTCDNQDPLSTKKLIPLLGIDVWEHAYYLQYKNARADYLNKIWEVVNWKNVEERFDNASKG